MDLFNNSPKSIIFPKSLLLLCVHPKWALNQLCAQPIVFAPRAHGLFMCSMCVACAFSSLYPPKCCNAFVYLMPQTLHHLTRVLTNPPTPKEVDALVDISYLQFLGQPYDVPDSSLNQNFHAKQSLPSSWSFPSSNPVQPAPSHLAGHGAFHQWTPAPLVELHQEFPYHNRTCFPSMWQPFISNYF